MLYKGQSQNNELRAALVNKSYPEGKLEIFSSPDVHLFVIRPKIKEVLSVDGEQTTCHRGGPEYETDIRTTC